MTIRSAPCSSAKTKSHPRISDIHPGDVWIGPNGISKKIISIPEGRVEYKVVGTPLLCATKLGDVGDCGVKSFLNSVTRKTNEKARHN